MRTGSEATHCTPDLPGAQAPSASIRRRRDYSISFQSKSRAYRLGRLEMESEKRTSLLGTRGNVWLWCTSASHQCLTRWSTMFKSMASRGAGGPHRGHFCLSRNATHAAVELHPCDESADRLWTLLSLNRCDTVFQVPAPSARLQLPATHWAQIIQNGGDCMRNGGGSHPNFVVCTVDLFVSAMSPDSVLGVQTCDTADSSHAWILLRTGHLQYSQPCKMVCNVLLMCCCRSQSDGRCLQANSRHHVQLESPCALDNIQQKWFHLLNHRLSLTECLIK